MNRLIYFIVGAVILLFAFVACEEKGENPGDFSLKTTLSVTGIKSTVLDREYEMIVERELDSAIMRFYTKNDTVFDDEGEPVIKPDGKLDITTDTIWYASQKTTHFVEMKNIELENIADTLVIDLLSNALWNAPMPVVERTRWFNTQNLSGGGDGTVKAFITRNGSNREWNAEQIIMTRDSTVIYKLRFRQIRKK